MENEMENGMTDALEAETAERDRERTLLPFDAMMLRYSELDGIIRGLGYDGAILMGARGSMPRYSIRRNENSNAQEISIFLRETMFPGSAYLAMVTRIPFGEHTPDEIYDILEEAIRPAAAGYRDDSRALCFEKGSAFPSSYASESV